MGLILAIRDRLAMLDLLPLYPKRRHPRENVGFPTISVRFTPQLRTYQHDGVSVVNDPQETFAAASCSHSRYRRAGGDDILTNDRPELARGQRPAGAIKE